MPGSALILGEKGEREREGGRNKDPLAMPHVRVNNTHSLRIGHLSRSCACKNSRTDLQLISKHEYVAELNYYFFKCAKASGFNQGGKRKYTQQGH